MFFANISTKLLGNLFRSKGAVALFTVLNLGSAKMSPPKKIVAII